MVTSRSEVPRTSQITKSIKTKLKATSASAAKINNAVREQGSREMVSISGNEINNNEIHGDLNIGSTVIKFPSFDVTVGAEALKKLITQHELLKESDPIYQMVLEELESKIKSSPSRTVIGLEAKLEIAGREVYLNQALISSQKAAKMISKLQHVKSYQIIFNHLLGLILTRFNAHILPMLKSGQGDITIRSAINATIIEPLYQEVTLAGGFVTSDLVEGMLYFLTEKCHVEWT